MLRIISELAAAEATQVSEFEPAEKSVWLKSYGVPLSSFTMTIESSGVEFTRGRNS
ncbi:hypothetical protein QJS04_geneDACA001026 [Acorus gramineus]|uniref:Uncharacterized protein n=1 Tax=Acorus gramineus TaxID=55184 RepID=A0AAV9AEG0_ACOGR|nr:hypothetical protein QJS04_geneDACA001026 [Acorus gramineus]